MIPGVQDEILVAWDALKTVSIMAKNLAIMAKKIDESEASP